MPVTAVLTENYISFELYAVTKSVSQPFYRSPFGTGDITVQQGGTALNLTPDVSDIAFTGPYATSGVSSGGIAVGNNWGQLIGSGGTDCSNQIVPAAADPVPVIQQARVPESLRQMSNSFSATPAVQHPASVSGGTLGMVKIADLFYIYNQTQQATTHGDATLQALAYTLTGPKFQSAVGTRIQLSGPTPQSPAGTVPAEPPRPGTLTASSGNPFANSNTGGSANTVCQILSGFNSWGGVASTAVTILEAPASPI